MPTTTTQRLPANRRLAEFIVAAPREHAEEALRRSRCAVLDTIGCMLVGIDEPVAQTVLQAVSPWGSGNAAVVGSESTLPGPWAALVNGSSAKAFDFDDWDDGGITHTTATLLPAILAALDDRSVTGFDLFDAHIVGVEVIARIGETINPSHYAKGWHATSTIGAIGAAAACSRALRLDAAETACALSLATSMAGGTTVQFGTMAKPMHAGFAAKAGLLAAALAAHGATAHADTLDGPVGFASMMSDATPADFEPALAKLGRPWAILEYGLHVKLYPSCGGTHRVVAAALELRDALAMEADDIDTVEINIPDYLCDLLPYRVPANVTEALFSYPYCVAAALVRGRLGIDEFRPEAIRNSEVLALANKVAIETRVVSDRSRLFLPGDPDTVTIKLRSGEERSCGVDIPYGAPPRFADNATVERKFYECASHRVTSRHASDIRDRVFARNDDWPLSDLFTLLGGARCGRGEIR